MNTRVMNILSAKEMVRVMTAYIDTFSKDFAPCKEEFEHAIHMLRREVGDEKVDKLLDAIDRRCEADLIFCGSLGYQANLKNFRDPIARTFMDVDFEDYLRVEVLQNMPQRARAESEIEEFRLSLTEDQRGVFEAVSSYLVFLELDLTKLAHYAGFMFANEMLYYLDVHINEKVGFICNHPYIGQIATVVNENGTLKLKDVRNEKDLDDIRKNILKTIEAVSSYLQFIHIIRPPYLPAFFKFTQHLLSAYDYSTFLGSMWTIVEFPNVDDNITAPEFVKIFRRKDYHIEMMAHIFP